MVIPWCLCENHNTGAEAVWVKRLKVTVISDVSERQVTRRLFYVPLAHLQDLLFFLAFTLTREVQVMCYRDTVRYCRANA